MTDTTAPPLDLDDVKAAIERAHAEVGAIAAEGAHRRWRMSIPAQPDRDSDLIISGALNYADVLAAEVKRLREEALAERARRIMSVLFVSRDEDCPQPFALVREQDETGMSGTGTVAHGVLFADGTVVIRWAGDYASTVVWDDLDKAMHVHGHRGATRVVWLSENLKDLADVEVALNRLVDAAEDVLAEAEQRETDVVFSAEKPDACYGTLAEKRLREAINAVPAVALNQPGEAL